MCIRDRSIAGIELTTTQGEFRVQDDPRFNLVIDQGNRVAIQGGWKADDTLDPPLPIRYHGPSTSLSGFWGISGSNNAYPIQIDVEAGPGCGLGTLPGDANGDGTVGFIDFLFMANNFGATDATFADGDFNCDGTVGFKDFLVLANNFGESVS